MAEFGNDAAAAAAAAAQCMPVPAKATKRGTAPAGGAKSDRIQFHFSSPVAARAVNELRGVNRGCVLLLYCWCCVGAVVVDVFLCCFLLLLVVVLLFLDSGLNPAVYSWGSRGAREDR